MPSSGEQPEAPAALREQHAGLPRAAPQAQKSHINPGIACAGAEFYAGP